jgi:hypothetical protein
MTALGHELPWRLRPSWGGFSVKSRPLAGQASPAVHDPRRTCVAPIGALRVHLNVDIPVSGTEDAPAERFMGSIGRLYGIGDGATSTHR